VKIKITEKYYKYVTAQMYVRLYVASNDTTMHKILIHSVIVIENTLLPIGHFSEEAEERNYFRLYLQGHFLRCLAALMCVTGYC